MEDKPHIKARSLYAQEYAKKAKTIHQSKNAMEHAYGAVEKKHGKEMREKLKSFHEANERGEYDHEKHGGAINLDHCKVSTHDKNSKHKNCW
jgi:hypothetical protein